jgi:hypothetical protein
MSTFNEEYIKVVDGIEHCPICKKKGCLADISGDLYIARLSPKEEGKNA